MCSQRAFITAYPRSALIFFAQLAGLIAVHITSQKVHVCLCVNQGGVKMVLPPSEWENIALMTL